MNVHQLNFHWLYHVITVRRNDVIMLFTGRRRDSELWSCQSEQQHGGLATGKFHHLCWSCHGENITCRLYHVFLTFPSCSMYLHVQHVLSWHLKCLYMSIMSSFMSLHVQHVIFYVFECPTNIFYVSTCSIMSSFIYLSTCQTCNLSCLLDTSIFYVSTCPICHIYIVSLHV